MKIAPIMKGMIESTDHILLMNVDELSTLIEVFTVYCEANKRKQKARKLLKQFEDELQIYSW